MKKLFTLLIAVVASIGTIFASDIQVDGIWYNFNSYNQTATVTYRGSSYISYDEYSGDIVIPDSVIYNDIKYGVTSIGERAFADCSNLSSITIGKSVKSIGAMTFAKCNNLRSVTWNAIHCNDFNEGNTPFYYNKDSYYGYDLRSKITSFIIGEDVEYLPAYLCAGMNNIEEKVLTCDIHCGLYAIKNSKFSQPDASLTELPDTVICAGEMICEGEKICTYSYSYYDSFDDNPGYEWNREAYEKGEEWPRCYNCGEYEATEMYHEFTEWVYSHKRHNITDAAECPDGMKCTAQCPGCQRYYTNTTIKQTYTNVKGCDSIVVRNIIMSKVQLPKIVAKPAIGEPNTGAIQIYDNSNGELASYGYFTLNGELISHASGNEETPYVISDLLPGVYNLVFYTELGCDSASFSCAVAAQHMKVGDVNYTFYDNEYGWNNEEDDRRGIPYHYAKVTYSKLPYEEREIYSGDIIIPDSVYFYDEYWPVTVIGEDAFRKSIVESVVIPQSVTKIKSGAFYSCKSLKYLIVGNEKCDFERAMEESIYTTYGGLVTSFYQHSWYNAQYTTVPIYVPYGSLNRYKNGYPHGQSKYDGIMNFHVINPKHVAGTNGATSATITFGNEEEVAHIASCGMVESDTTAGNILEYIGLEPNSEYKDIPFFIITKEGDHDTLHYSFKTSALTLTTRDSKPVSSNTAILLAETNMADVETNCGFEWRRQEQPEEMASTKVYCPVANGTIAGRLKGLKDNVYYKYRAFYQSVAGNMYYGDWKYIFTGDVTVDFDPVMYTYPATGVKETEATIKGYALAGASDFDEQGFEYWVESRVPNAANSSKRIKAALGEHYRVAASGISMKVTLTDLDAGSVYKYCTYAKIGDNVVYGSVMSFTTQGEYVDESATDIDQISNDQSPVTNKIIKDNQIFILRDGKIYTITGQKIQ